MANQIILKRSATPGKAPTASQLALGEIAINTYDGLIYIKKDDGTPSIAQIGGVTSVNTKTGAIVLTSDDVAQGSTNKYFSNAQARAAISAGTGISYNSSTGAISTSQSITSSATPTFAGMTLTGNLGMTGSIIPSADITYDLGSPTKQWRDIYVGPGSLYVNGSKVLEDINDTITFSADVDQNIRIKTLGTGRLQLGSSSTVVEMDGTFQMASGKRITDSAGVNVQFGNAIQMNGAKVVGVGTPSANTDAATKGYVDSTVGALSTSSITQGNSSVQVVDSGTGTVTVTVDGSTALTVTADGVVVAGNFTVSGTQTTVNSNTISLADNIITLNSDTTGTPTQNAGVDVERGDEANVQLRWNEGSQKWTFTNNGAVYYPMAVATDDLAEGSTNVYFTNTRARNAVSSSSATGIAYNSTTGLFSLGSIPNSALTNNSISINGASVALGGTRTLGTDDVAEGAANKYYTDARARGAVSGGTGISYNSATGAITNTITQYTDALAVGANTGAIATAKSEAISTAASDATTKANAAQTAAASDATAKVAAEATARATAVTAAISTAASDATAKVAAEATARDAAIATAVATKDNTDEITEGSTNLYFTTARARGAVSGGTGISYNSATGAITNTITQYTDALALSANTSAIATAKSEAISTAATDATSKVASEATARATAVTAAISTAATDATSKVASEATARATAVTAAISTAATDATNKVAAEATARDAAIATAVATKDNTDEITEGTTNLYFTTARARSSVSAGGSLSYNSSTGVFSYTTPSTSGITEGTNLYYTDARARAAITAGTGITVTSGVVATTITQYTDALARGAVSFTAGSGAYNSSTGVFTIPTNTNQLTNGAGFIVASSNTSGTHTGPVSTSSASTLSGTVATGALTVTGAITATGEVTAYFSDLRLKTNIVQIADALEKVEAINGVTFDPNETALALGIDDRHQMGVIAQEVEAVAPELVCDSAFAGYKTVRYDKLTALLIEAVKELSAKVKTLEAQLGNTKPTL